MGTACPAMPAAISLLIKRPESYTHAQLTNLLSRLQQVYQGVLICVQESEHLRKELLAAWQRDLNFIGGTLPKGLPNSPALGIQSSNGLSYGEFAVKIRGHLQVRRCWNLVVVGAGRRSPFPGGNLLANVVTTFDGLLFTTDTHKYKGLAAHVDSHCGEPGQWQALAVVHPPPPGVRRLGIALVYYPVNTWTWTSFVQALVTRWRTSPDLGLRQSPRLSLGSQATGKALRVHGGPYLPKDRLSTLSDEDLLVFCQKLHPRLQALVPAKPDIEMPSIPSFLQAHGFDPISEAQLARERSDVDDNQVRRLYLRVLASGAKPAARFVQLANATTEGQLVVDGAIKFGSADKLEMWIGRGGRKRRKPRVVLQPSGHVANWHNKREGTMKSIGTHGPTI